ncbi:site-specific recombinase XerC [Bradyrhizobium sp. LM6.10]
MLLAIPRGCVLWTSGPQTRCADIKARNDTATTTCADASQSSYHAPVQSRLPCGCPHGRDRQAGISAHTPAQLCHHLLEQNIDIIVIQVLLGHAKLDTTALYTRLATKTIREIMSLRDHIMGKLKEAEPPA